MKNYFTLLIFIISFNFFKASDPYLLKQIDVFYNSDKPENYEFIYNENGLLTEETQAYWYDA